MERCGAQLGIASTRRRLDEVVLEGWGDAQKVRVGRLVHLTLAGFLLTRPRLLRQVKSGLGTR